MFYIYEFILLIFIIFSPIFFLTRIISGKEDPKRFLEKLCLYSKSRNVSKTIWFHGASIGEINSIIPIIKYFLKKNEDLKILITSVTLSSSKIFENEFKKNKNIIHKYFPVDVPYLIRNFIKEYKPSLVVFVDSEIWPNCIVETKKKKYSYSSTKCKDNK